MIRKFSILLVMITATAVCANAQLRWNVEAGVGFSNVTKMDNSDYLVGFKAGLGFSYFFNDDVSLDPSIMVISKGFSRESKAITYSERPIYIQLPVFLSYNLMLDHQFGLEFGAGPYLAYGFAGKSKGEVDIFGIKGVSDMNLFSKDNPVFFKDRIDAGLCARVGVTFRDLALFAGFERGLLELNHDSNKSLNSYGFSVTVQYRF